MAVPPPAPATRIVDKRALRQVLRERRRTAAAGAAAAAAAGTVASPRPGPAFVARLAPGLVVASYRPIDGEADPGAFDAAVLAAGGRLALPHVVDRATPLRFLLVEDGAAALASGPFGLANPHPHWQEVAPAVVLTPLVGFDRRGHRLGQGAGHYDRAFAIHAGAWRVGVAWAAQEVETMPNDPWDLPLHAIATDREWIEVSA